MVYELDGRPSLATAVPLGLQHVLAMFTSNLAPVLIVAAVCGLSGADTVTMVQCAMFVSGLTTFIQLYPLRLGSRYQVGARLPIVMGTSFTFVPTASAVGAAGGIGAVLGMVDTSSIAGAAWFGLPLPLQFHLEFQPAAIMSFAALFVTSGLETIGNTSGITMAGFDREATERETSGAILADALGSTTAAVFNALPNTAFGQNAGIVAMTRVVNRWCIATGAFILMISGFFPKLGALFPPFPTPFWAEPSSPCSA